MQTTWCIDQGNRVPTAHEEQNKLKMAKEILCLGKHREFENVAKTQEILFAQVVNSLILKVKDIAIFAGEIFNFLRSWIIISAKSVSM